jgi:phage terminase large subunit
MNEANSNKLEVYNQLAMRTTGPKILDLNPSDFNCWVYDLADNPKNKRLHSTYKDNLANLTQEQIDHIEGYKNLPDQYHWDVYGLGKRGASEEIIYRGWELCDSLPGKGDVFYGLDFGFVHPTSFNRVEYYEGAYYIEELIYESGLTNPVLGEKIKTFETGYGTIYCDSAEAGTIEEFYRMGLNVKQSNKDVWAGIIFMKGCRLFIKRDSKNVIREIQGYKWKKDKNDKILEEPVKENDDAMDSIRYAIYTQHKKPVRQWLTL